MTAKEQVLNIYPTAKASRFSYCGQSLWSVNIYCVNRFETLAEEYTEERVWKRAWKLIQYEMLDKLAD
jgi:hypothetical protein